MEYIFAAGFIGVIMKIPLINAELERRHARNHEGRWKILEPPV